jgi:hypothetical protein
MAGADYNVRVNETDTCLSVVAESYERQTTRSVNAAATVNTLSRFSLRLDFCMAY